MPIRKIQQNVGAGVSGKESAGEPAEVKVKLWLVCMLGMAEITNDTSRHIAAESGHMTSRNLSKAWSTISQVAKSSQGQQRETKAVPNQKSDQGQGQSRGQKLVEQ